MATRAKPELSSRKAPQQARSTELVAAILEAAVQVLAREGAQRFTTARVAERAGVSVGSVYQYFPNKAAILFRLQTDEWQQTGRLLAQLLQDERHPPLERLRRLVHAFVQSECDEAAMRTALHDAAPLYRDDAQARRAKADSGRAIARFLRELLPHAPPAQRKDAADLIMDTLSAVGQQFSEQPRTSAQIRRRSAAMGQMLSAYLVGLGAQA